ALHREPSGKTPSRQAQVAGQSAAEHGLQSIPNLSGASTNQALRRGTMPLEYAFEIASAAIRFGVGVTREVGAELVDLGKKHALVFADPNLRYLTSLATVLESLQE